MPSIGEWMEKHREAASFMDSRKNEPDVLIEVSAQHPLHEGKYPNIEFEKRLRAGMQLREQMMHDVRGTVWMLVPGSRHRVGEIADDRSLSEAGREFLEQQGIPSGIILGEEEMERFKGPDHRWPGVYNSADEAFVAASVFKERENMGALVSVVSIAQATRKKLHYLWNGVLPQMSSIRPKKGYHNPFKEWTMAIPYTLFIDPDWQSRDSKSALKSRQERKVMEH